MIDSYSFGNIMIDGKEYTHDVIITGSNIIEWWRQEGHFARVPDFKDIPDDTEILVIGTGDSGVMKVAGEVVEHFRKKKIKVIMEMTGTAVNTFNKLTKENKNVVGAFHLTC
jgi:hypothetical protein